MSTTVSYKGNTIATVENATKKLTTQGTWLEDDITITDSTALGGALIVDTTDSHGGIIREITTGQDVVSLQAQKTITPTSTSQTVIPDTGYDGFESVVFQGGFYSADEIATKTDLSGAVVLNGTSIAQDGLKNKTLMTSLSSTTVTTMGRAACMGCTGLTSIYFPNLSTGAFELFYNCSGLTIIHADDLKSLTYMSQSLFQGCTSLTTIVMPKVYGGGYRIVYDCSALTTIDVGKRASTGGNFQAGAFSGAINLTTLILRRLTVMAIGNVSAFDGTPFASGGTGGTIYIPEELYNHLGDGTGYDYKAATNWSTIDGYGTITWAKIEGSQYENYYADGTAIPVG